MTFSNVLDRNVTLVDRLQAWADATPSAIAYRLLPKGVQNGWEEISYADLMMRVEQVSAELSFSAASGDRAILWFEPSLEFIVGFFACLKSGVVAVPIAPATSRAKLALVSRVIRDAAPSILLVAPGSPSFAASFPDIALPSLVVDLTASPSELRAEERHVDANDLAFLQYTSGSTSQPKGVMVSHANLLHNLGLMEIAFGKAPADAGVSWLPFYHDMGLMGGILQPVYRGVTVSLLTPAAFLRDPFLWLEAISHFRATISGAPNFAYDLAARSVSDEQLATLDLSHWRVAINGAEPVRAATLERFCERFAPAGFRRSAFMPAYGMAETTLLISSAGTNCEPRLINVDEQDDLGSKSKARTMVGCGMPASDTRVAIVDTSTRRSCADGTTGEIWVQSDSVALGYWHRDRETKETFRARIEGDEEAGHWLRTGDLGLIRDGEVFVTGRAKNLIIVRGRNLQAEDVELVATQASPHLETSGAAAFANENGSDKEQFVVLIEISHATLREIEASDLLGIIRSELALRLEAQPDLIALVPRGALPRTTSGKVQRHVARDRLASGMMLVIASDDLADGLFAAPGPAAPVPLADDMLDRVLALAAGTLKVAPERIDVNRPLTMYGLDSLGAAQLHRALCDSLQVDIELVDLIECNSVQALANRARECGQSSSVRAPCQTIAENSATFPLTEMQQAYVVGRGSALADGGVPLQGYVEFECASLDLARFTDAWNALITRHDMLRAVADGISGQRILPNVPRYEPTIIDLTGLSPTAVEAALAEFRSQTSHKVAPLEAWPQFEIAAISHDYGIRLAMRIDGTFIDLHSFGILARDFASLYDGRALPEVTREPGTRFADHVAAIGAERASDAYAASLGWWRERLTTMPGAPELPSALGGAAPGARRFERLAHRLDGISWAALTRSAAEAGCTRAAVLLTIYAMVIARWSATQTFTLNLPVANRRDPAFEQTVGNFSSFILLSFDFTTPLSFRKRVQRVQSDMFACLQHQIVPGMTLVRERLSNSGELAAATMPVVFTETPRLGDEAAQIERDFANVLGGRIAWEITQTPQVSLDCQVRYLDSGVEINWDYVAGQFPDGVVDAMFGAFTGLLDQLTDAEAWDQDRLEVLPVEQRAVREALFRPRAIAENSLFDMIARIEARDPHAIAVIDCEGTCTYSELLSIARRLARLIGSDPSTPVAVAVPKGRFQIASVLAAIATGSPYLPLDPTWPSLRAATCLADSGCRRVVTTQALRESLDLADNIVVIDCRSDAVATATPIEAPARPGDLAYILYTSGSTGTPKGVRITQVAVINAIVETNAHFDVAASDRVLGLTELHHDMSVFDIFGTLSAGATVVLPDPVQRKDPAHWLDLIDRHQVSIWNSVPAMLEMLAVHVAAHAGRTPPTSLRLVFLGGDWIPVALPDQLATWRGDTRVVSVGGPTETTLWNIWHEVNELSPQWSSIPYGKPIANTRYHILNAGDEDCPDWVPGEMCCAGIGVTPGYVGGAEDAKKFGRHPVSGERIYRTGDLGRYRSDGTIEFLGRTDFQLKLRGVRIEPGEIEHALAQHEDINQATVVVVGQGADMRLGACVVLTAQARERDTKAGDRQAQLLQMAAALSVDEGEDILADPVARIQFKIDDRSLRRDLDREGIGLPTSFGPDDLFDEHLLRQSHRSFETAPLPLTDFAGLLEVLRRARHPDAPIPKLRYPSAGGLYPVQTYVYVKADRISGLDAGYYYYDPASHRLVSTGSDIDPSPSYIGYLAPTYEAAAFAIFLVADLEAIQPMYGDRSRDFCLIESGYMGQLLSEAAPECDIGLCPIGAIAFDPIARRLRLHDRHVLVHSMVGGSISPFQKLTWDVVRVAPTKTQPGSAAWLADVRSSLARRLPPAFVPVEYHLVEALPLNPNGKVDRRVISGFFKASARVAEDYHPLNDAERRIADAIREVIGADRAIGPDVNFFDVGANSLHLVQLQAKLSAETGHELSVVDIFEHSTVRRLASFLGREEPPPPTSETDVAAQRAEKQRAAIRQQRRVSPR